jgi:hypothetical protein
MSETWCVIDCGKVPSDSGCMLKIKAPASQVEDLLDAAVDHAVGKHGHERTPELREQIRGMVEYKEHPLAVAQ